MAAELKAKGTQAFQNKDYDEAIKYYGEAIALSNSDHLLYSNRSAAYAGAKKYEEALTDAQKCIELKPDFAKGYGRMGLAQYHMNKLMDAKRSYQEGLKHDSQSQVLKDGLRDTQRGLRSLFLTIFAEAASAQSVIQQKVSEATHQLVSEGSSSLSFLEAHKKIVQLNLPEDTLEKHGISEEEFTQSIEDYEKAHDYEMITALQQMFAPSGKGDPEKAGKLDVAKLVEVHQFMEMQMTKILAEFTKLPEETQQSIPKKEREHAAELLVSVSVESHFKIQSEDLELAVGLQGEMLQADAAFVECQNQLSSLLKLMTTPPFIERAVEHVSKPESTLAADSMSANPRVSALVCNIGVISVLGLAVLLGVIRLKARSR